jgi:hypothetical protein
LLVSVLSFMEVHFGTQLCDSLMRAVII